MGHLGDWERRHGRCDNVSMAEKYTLRDGSETADRRLDRLVQFDERSRNFGVAEVLPEGFKSKTWRLHERLDQGREGACVGFGTTHRIAALPISFGGASYDYAYKLYKAAQKLDPWEGENYEGTSVLAGVKAAKALGHFTEYRWCFTIEDYMRAVANEGPVIVGSHWLDSMWDPDERGLLDTSGKSVGGHCYIIRGLTLSPRGIRQGVGPVFRITNSWGPDWGEGGEAYITVEDFERNIMPGGEGVVPTEARVARATTEEAATVADKETSERVGRGKFPWAPTGTSLFDRVLGFPYSGKATVGTDGAKLSGRGKPAGRFFKGPFTLGR